MSTNLEIEAKAMITKADYDKLLLAYKNTKKYTQKNYYISSSEMLDNREKYGLRIRTKNRKLELTLKVTEEIGRKEINQEISQKSLVNLKYFKKFPTGEVSDYLTKNKICDVSKLIVIGSLKTIRIDIRFGDSLISIDKSKYNGLTDYEIECENSSIENAESDLKKFIEQYKISYQKSELSKLARFLNSK